MEISPKTLVPSEGPAVSQPLSPSDLPDGEHAGVVADTAVEREAGHKVRVLLVDDEERVRRGLGMRLEIEQDFEVVGEASDGRVTTLVAELCPDVVLMDVAMPVMDGIAGAAALERSAPRVAIVMLSLYDDAETRRRAAAAGAFGFVGKHQPEAELVAEIRRAARSSARPPANG